MENTSVPVSEAPVVARKVSKEALLVAGSILLGSLIIAGSILSFMPKNAGVALGDKAGTPTLNPTALPTEGTNVTVSLDDDAVLGDKKKAKVAIVEFTDYECPFCKRFHADTFDTLVKDYVDTGKAIISIRDFPLSFHDPKATAEAAILECARKEKGDAAYFTLAKGVYENTQTNGKGLLDGKLDELIRKVGANPTSVNKCAETQAVKDEIAKDIADGQAVGISGTPSFVIGKVDDKGNVVGERIVGALPLAEFKKTVEKYMAQ